MSNDDEAGSVPAAGAEAAATWSGPAPAPRWAVIGIFLMMLVGGLAYARAFLMPTVLAFLIALTFSPVRRFLERRGVPATASAALITGGLLAVVLASTLALAAPVSNWVDNAPAIGREVREKLREVAGTATNMRDVAEQIEDLAAGEEEPGVQEVVVKEPGIASNAALLAPAVLAQIVFTMCLLFFILASGDMFYEKIVHVLPTFRDKRVAIRIAHDIERKLSRYLFTITAINAGLGLVTGLSMWALGMPNPALLGAIGFLFNYVPYVGSIAASAIALVVGLASLDAAYDAFFAAGIYFLLTAVEGQFVTPYFVGRSLRLNTVVVFLSVTLWAWLWSVVGMLVAVPLLVTIRTFSEHIPALHGLGYFLSARGAETDDAAQVQAQAAPALTPPAVPEAQPPM